MLSNSNIWHAAYREQVCVWGRGRGGDDAFFHLSTNAKSHVALS